MTDTTHNNEQQAVAVWDWPVRLTHWLFVACIAFSWWSAEQRQMEWHLYSGYTLLGLLVFRIYWGFAGSSSARFSQFLRSPGQIMAYLRETPTRVREAGHNPLGALSVIALLLLMLTQVGIGLFVTDIDGLDSGPLSHMVSFETSRALAGWHDTIFNVLLVFIGLHIAAVLFYLLARRQNLIGAMVTGKQRAANLTAMRPVPVWRVLPGIALAAAVVWFITWY